MNFLAFVARRGRWVLPTGLAIGVAAPGLARAMEPLIVPILAALLFLAALRIGPGAVAAARVQLPRTLALTAALQVVPPLVAVALFTGFGVADNILAIGVVLVLAASPITGLPGLVVLSGADPAPALRQLVIGTALLPLTVLPVLAVLPVFESPGAVILGALRLMAIILLAGAGGMWLRSRLPRLARPEGVQAVDALTALGMGLLVIALTSAIGPALLSADPMLWAVLALVTVLNFASQGACFVAVRSAGGNAPALAIAAGNRNLALFLAALPPATAQEMLLFVGCYQVPMFLTPILLAPLYRRASDSA